MSKHAAVPFENDTFKPFDLSFTNILFIGGVASVADSPFRVSAVHEARQQRAGVQQYPQCAAALRGAAAASANTHPALSSAAAAA